MLTSHRRAPRPKRSLLVEADTGKVLHAENATMPWYPASITKLMTAYVTLQAVKEGRITLDTLFTVSPQRGRAGAVQDGLQAGHPGHRRQRAQDADGEVGQRHGRRCSPKASSGSVENFADEMNRTAQRLGMTQSNCVNPNGLPADEQITSARDLAILARALIHDFPEYDYYWHIPGDPVRQAGHAQLQHADRPLSAAPTA